MCTTSIESVFFYLTPSRRKLLEARRTYIDIARNQFQVVLDTWESQEYRQIQGNRQLLERASALISRKAEEFINKAIENTLKDCKLGNIQLVDGNLGRRASTDKRQVCSDNTHTHSIYMY